MKAKEYFDKYHESIMTQVEQEQSEEYNKTITSLMIEMIDETKTVIDARHIKTNSGIVSVIKEFNQKWNTLCGLFVKKYGISPLLENGFKNYWIKTIPSLASVL